ncbi:hypothetical protein [Bacillus altitudinis]|uniref:hypothetical protein n=1 Tax=Bacillus altitudinis TaxID=293387 RepID=UPI00366F670E
MTTLSKAFGFGIWLLPHYVTERCALVRRPSGKYFPLCRVDMLLPGDYYEAVATVSYLNILGLPFFVRFRSQIVPRVTLQDIVKDLHD